MLWTTGSVPTSVTSQIDYAEPSIDVNSALTLRLDSDGDGMLAGVSISGNERDITSSEGYFFWGTEGRLSYDGSRIIGAEKDAMTYEADVRGDVDFQPLNTRKLENFVASVEGVVEPAVPGESSIPESNLGP